MSVNHDPEQAKRCRKWIDSITGIDLSYFSHLEAFLGQLLFGEAQITLWWVGISLTFSGLLVLQRVSPQDRQPSAVAKRDE